MAEDEGITVKKDENFSEWYTQVINKAELADIRFGVQGFIVHRPWSFFILRKIYEYLEKEVEEQGHLPYQFPRVVKEADLAREEEHAGFTPEVFWVSEAGTKKIEERFALPPTGEAQIYPMYALWFRSYRDLPFRGYQSRLCVYRNEMTTRPFLRGREFMFFETHNVYNTHQEALDQIEKDVETCDVVFKDKCKLPFLYFKRPKWDAFLGADATFTPDTLMPDGRRNQLGSTHDLGTNFSKAYDIKVVGKDEKEHLVYQTCFGPGIWRILAGIIGVHGDDKGLVIPFDMAPVQVVIVPITFTKKPEASRKVLSTCKKVKEQLVKAGFRVKFDDGDDVPGVKYNKWELRGVPLRIEIGPRDIEKESVMFSIRNSEEKISCKLKELKKSLVKFAARHDQDIQKNGEKYFEDRVRSAKTLKEVVKIMKEHRGFVKVPFCAVDAKGEKCADVVKAETEGTYVCGTLYPKEEKVPAKSKCIVCKKKAEHIVYLAKSY